MRARKLLTNQPKMHLEGPVPDRASCPCPQTSRGNARRNRCIFGHTVYRLFPAILGYSRLFPTINGVFTNFFHARLLANRLPNSL